MIALDRGKKGGDGGMAGEHDSRAAAADRSESMDADNTCRWLKGLPPFQTTFAVPMHCENCVDETERTLSALDGVISVSTSLSSQILTVKGTTAPSVIVAALQLIGRDAILRGSGASNSAAVAILETYEEAQPAPSRPAALSTDNDHGHQTSPVRGLVRAVQVAPGLTLFDVSVSGLQGRSGREREEGQGAWWAVSVRAYGDVSRGLASTGGVWAGWDDDGREGRGVQQGQRESSMRGYLGRVRVDSQGSGTAVLVKAVEVWELIGRGLAVQRTEGEGEQEQEQDQEAAAVVGVIARSAGAWDNDKTVCSCSGKTAWEEREEQRERGMP